jgi:membrane protein DedA with SNARE-associated domain
MGFSRILAHPASGRVGTSAMPLRRFLQIEAPAALLW